MSDFGKYIRDKRVEAGLTIREVAAEIGVSEIFMGKVERGKEPLDNEYWEPLTNAVLTIEYSELERLSENSSLDAISQPGVVEEKPSIMHQVSKDLFFAWYKDNEHRLFRRISELEANGSDTMHWLFFHDSPGSVDPEEYDVGLVVESGRGANRTPSGIKPAALANLQYLVDYVSVSWSIFQQLDHEYGGV